MEKRDVLDYRYLASIWILRLFSRYCDICKDFRFEIPAIHSRYMKSGFSAYTLEVSVIFIGIFLDFQIRIEISLRSLVAVKNRSLTIRSCYCLEFYWQL
jgi:hypothetical protein